MGNIIKKKPKQKYWSIEPIKKIPAQYRIIYGERSNGKTYGVLKEALREYAETGGQFAYVRRWGEDIKRNKMGQLFAAHAKNEEFKKLTNDKWNGIQFQNREFRLFASDLEDTKIVDEKPCGFVFALSEMEHNKSISFPDVRIIIFDEFISRTSYIPDEFTLFMNTLSTIIRDRDDVVIYMLGNTVSKDCPYFREMGLRHVYQQEAGTIDTYSYKKNGQELIIAVEYTKNLQSKKSDKYFIFDNPKMEMITGGSWELAIYQHLFEKYKPKQVKFIFFILYRNETLQCEVVKGERDSFIYVHKKTTPLKDENKDLIYSITPESKRNWRTNITKPFFPIEKRIVELITNDKICFQDNEVGEVFNDYLKWCRQHTVIKR